MTHNTTDFIRGIKFKNTISNFKFNPHYVSHPENDVSSESLSAPDRKTKRITKLVPARSRFIHPQKREIIS